MKMEIESFGLHRLQTHPLGPANRPPLALPLASIHHLAITHQPASIHHPVQWTRWKTRSLLWGLSQRLCPSPSVETAERLVIPGSGSNVHAIIHMKNVFEDRYSCEFELWIICTIPVCSHVSEKPNEKHNLLGYLKIMGLLMVISLCRSKIAMMEVNNKLDCLSQLHSINIRKQRVVTNETYFNIPKRCFELLLHRRLHLNTS